MARIENVFTGLLLAVILLPLAISMYLGVDTTNWPSTLKMIWDALPILAVAGVAIGFIGYVRYRK